MAENLNAKSGEPITTCGYFGLLGADFEKSTGKLLGDYYEKPSYYAFRNLCSILDENVIPNDIPVIFTPKESRRIAGCDCPTKELIYGGLIKSNGAKAFVYWNSTDMVTCGAYESTVTFEISGVNGVVRLIDPNDGVVYEVGDDIKKQRGTGVYLFENMPVKDYPLILTFGEFI